MNHKPVAWMDEHENVIFEKNWAYPIPLYTHPVKELTLTNDEIREIGDECTLNNNGILNWLEFAKAILRKAQEK